MLPLLTAALLCASGDAGVNEPDDAGVFEPDAGFADAGTDRALGAMPVGDTKTPDAFGLRIGGGFVTEWGTHPESILGASLGVRLGVKLISLLLEGWTIFPTTWGVTTVGSLNLFSLGGHVGLCTEWWLLTAAITGCVMGRGGAMLVEGYATNPVPRGWQPSAAAGARVGLEWPRDEWIGLYVSTQAFVPIVRPRVTSDGASWVQPWVLGGGQIGIRVRPK